MSAMQEFFDGWQRKLIGRMLTFLLSVFTAGVVLYLLVQIVHAIAFLQPVLIPLAMATILAFLLEPVVRVLCARTHRSRTVVVLTLMAIVALSVAAAGVYVVPKVYESTVNMIHDAPAFAEKAQQKLFALLNATQRKVDSINKQPPPPPPGAALPKSSSAADVDPQSSASGNPAPSASPGPIDPQKKDSVAAAADLNKNGTIDVGDLQAWLSGQLPKLQAQAPALLQNAGDFILSALGGFMGSVGVLLNAVIIPIYIFFLLTEAREISKQWTDYLPLKDSQFKQEVVSTLGEVHTYLVAFFRGQLIVSSIDATLITIGLLCIGLKFAVVIGLLVLVLTFIPYLGILICYVPAVLIALVQFGDFHHVALVLGVMVGVQVLESTIIAPKIVGESTGLHPLTVIISVFTWELVLGGPIGALLAVPLTASVKVLMRRYVWERARMRARILPTANVAPVLRAGDRDAFGDGEPDVTAVPEAVAHPHENPIAPPQAESANPPSGTKD